MKSDSHTHYGQKIRRKILRILGDKCVRCGFSDWRALQVDHVNGDGNKERSGKQFDREYRGYRSHNNYSLLNAIQESLRNGENKYQLLCANCNWIKKYENNEVGKRESE